MRKIETIKKEIERAEARIVKANEAIKKAEARRANAVAKCEKAGYTYQGDGEDAHRAYDQFKNWDIAWGPVSTADQAGETIEKNKTIIFGSKRELEGLRYELNELQEKLDAIPQAIKDYEVELFKSLVHDAKFRRDWAQGKIEELKEDGEWVTSEDLDKSWQEAYKSNTWRGPAWEAHEQLKAKKAGQDRLSAIAGESDESIERSCKAEAHGLILDLAFRVMRCVGKATDCSGLHIEDGTQGYSVLNGVVVGEKGRCEVVSKGVAGYNIIRWHIRVNVWPLKGEN